MGVFKRFGEWLKKLRNKKEPEAPIVKVTWREAEKRRVVYQTHRQGNDKILRKVKLYPAIRQVFEDQPNDLRFRHQRQLIGVDEGWYIISKKEGCEIIPVGRFIIADDPYDAIAKL